MRLRKIRLAGFKSFVDPTTVTLPGDLVGVVGPNGCGKSNIIDAVRWVMGEISAKHLRGGTMADVVFTGSNTRKAVSQASVELVFDNADGRLGGRFASFSEVAVRREVGREGQSSYYLNGGRCRRRDVMDVFLGTGLGPRSYAIIEQGMISRVVEARPEDLREFLEEAAGISRYKERRRETEHRIRHTQENLDRLSDLREELGKRLAHLKRQATVAEKYRGFKQRERALQAELEALRWRELDARARTQGEHTAEQETRLEARLAEQRALEARVEKQRAAQADASERFNEVYRQVLDAGAAIARNEETIQNLRARREQLSAALGRERERLRAAREQFETEQRRVDQLAAAVSEKQPKLERLQHSSNESQLAFREAEEAYLEWQLQGEALSERVAAPSQVKHAEQGRIEQLEQNLARLRDALEGLNAQHASTGTAPAERGRLAELEQAVDASSAALEAANARAQAAQARVRELRDRLREEGERLHQVRDRAQSLRGRLSSLEALQLAALGKDRDAVAAWLDARGLADQPRLAERIEVQPGWEAAVESVLDSTLEAISVPDLAALADALTSLAEGGLCLVEQRVDEVAAAARDSLASRVEGGPELASLLAEVFTADSVEQAIAARTGLQAHQRLVTPDGIQVGRDWLKLPRRRSAQSGVLAREREIHAAEAQLSEVLAELEACDARARDARDALEQAEEQAARVQHEQAECQERRGDAQSRLAEIGAQLAQARREAQERARRIQELESSIASEEQVLHRARERLRHSDEEMVRLSGERADWEQMRDSRRVEMERARDRWHALRDEAYELGLELEGLRAQLDSLRDAQRRGEELSAQLAQRVEELETEQQGIEQPLATAEQALQGQLVTRRDVERTLQQARAEVERTEGELQSLQSGRQKVEAGVDEARSALEALRVAAQEILVRRSTCEERLQQLGHAPGDLLAGLDSDAEVAQWEQKLIEMERRISRLGPINLAAIEEYEQQSERKTYLDAQHADLEEALSTLQAAIQKIDRETRARFKETYEKVNTGLKRLFPRLFGGGQAELQMTGEDLLSTGISVQARPPGKRNTNIHLLSGGEKALTAVALVFAIFELNPAPFCLLDEVDAPLDDANVARFCELVKDMSDQVQFVLVTHNKITMEIAHQLIGVTMNEPGVSRLVAVDIDEAVEMAAA